MAPYQLSELNKKLEGKLRDDDYKSFFSKFTSEKLKSIYFIDDLPDIQPRNAFKIDKKGDKNNICFDSCHYKQLCKYNVPYERSFNSSMFNNKTNTMKKTIKLTKKQLRKKFLNEAKTKRYYSQINKIKDESVIKSAMTRDQLSQSSLSNKMWLYLEMKHELEQEHEKDALANVDKTSDYIKYLDENSSDINKWLEFIEYQSEIANKIKFDFETESNLNESVSSKSFEINTNPLALFERKISIFDKAIKLNPSNLRIKLERIKFKAKSFEIINQYNTLESIEKDFVELLISESLQVSTPQTLKKLTQSTQLNILSIFFEIWFEYLKFLLETNSSNITFNKLQRTYQKCFQFFLSTTNQLIINCSNSYLYYSNILQLVDAYCNYLSKNGYIEKVIGIYQAIIAFNFVSTETKENFLQKKLLFEIYWDLNLPRFGEKQSIGWTECLKNREEVFKKLENDEETIFSNKRYDDQLDLIENKILQWSHIRIEYRWLEIERLRSLLNWYPFYPNIVNGESADDCCDSDRLVSFEDDLSFLLFDLTSTLDGKNKTDISSLDYFRFILFCKLLKNLNLISWNEEYLDLRIKDRQQHSISCFRLEEDGEYMKYLNDQLKCLNDENCLEKQDVPFCGNFDFLQNLFHSLVDAYQPNEFRSYAESDLNDLRLLIKRSIKDTIDFVRNCFKQIISQLETNQFKTNITILKWKFELYLLDLNKKLKDKLKKLAIVSGDNDLNYFDFSKVKENLLNETKQVLSLEHNRNNFDLWKQYGILKWLLNNQYFFVEKQTKTKILNEKETSLVNLKETRKVFDNLLLTTAESTSITSLTNVYSLCSDYVQIELGLFYEQFDVNTSNVSSSAVKVSLASVYFQNGFFNLKQENLNTFWNKEKDLLSIKQNFVEILSKNCLYRTVKQNVTFKIGMTGSTKLLLMKRDFQNEYERQIGEYKIDSQNEMLQKKLYHFHKVYSLFLLCVNDFEKLIEISDRYILKEPILDAYQSVLIEFYLSLLNYLYYNEVKLTKFMYKTKLFTIIRATFSSKANSITTCGQSYLRLLQLTLLRLKLKSSNLFCSQMLENNDIDLIFNKIFKALSPSQSSNILLTLIYSVLNKLENILEKFTTTNERNEHEILLTSSNLGIQHQVRRLFENGVKLNPLSLQLWLFYFKFEFEKNINILNKYQLNSFQNRILYIYYQSIRNLPYCKILYVNGVKCLPEKYIEIMNLMSNREIRVYFPIQELNLLLEPIRKPGELWDEKNKSDEEHVCDDESENQDDEEDNESISDDEDNELIEINENSNDSSVHSISNLDLNDI